MTNPEFIPPVDLDVSEEIGELMQSANEKLRWARDKAKEFLEHANYLEERANMFRKLAADMVMEAHAFNDEVADLIAAEFPMEVPEEEEGEEIDAER